MMIKTNLYLACINIFRNKKKSTLTVLLISIITSVLLICVLLLFGFISLSLNTTGAVQNNGLFTVLSNIPSTISQEYINFTYPLPYNIGTIIDISMTISIILVISVITVIYILFISRILKSQKYISSLKAIGYDDKTLTKMITMEHAIILLLSYSVSIISSTIAIFCIQHIIHNTLGFLMPIYYGVYILFVIPLVIFCIFITQIAYKVAKKRTVTICTI